MLVPERAKRLDQPQPDGCPLAAIFGVSGARFECPGQGGAQVVVFCLQTVQRRQVRRAAQLAVRTFSEGRVVLRMPVPGVAGVAAALEQLERVLADRLEHSHSRLAVGALGHRDQADVQQAGDLL